MGYRVMEKGPNGRRIEHGCYLTLKNAEERAQQIRVKLTERLMREASRLTGIVRGKNAERYRQLVSEVGNLAQSVSVEKIFFWDD